MKNVKKLLSAVMTTVLLTFAACDAVECPINNVVYSTYGFYAVENGVAGSVSVLDTLTITAGGSDSILINRLQGGSSVHIPVSYTATTDTLIFHFVNEAQEHREDTIWIDKENIRHYESPNCPASMFHIVTSTRWTGLLIDSVVIVNPNIDYNVSENFQIYFSNGD